MYNISVNKLKSFCFKTIAVILCIGSFMGVSPKAAVLQNKGVVCASEIKSDVKSADKESEKAAESVIVKGKDANTKKPKTVWVLAKSALSALLMLITPSGSDYVRGKLATVEIRNLIFGVDAISRYSSWGDVYWLGESIVTYEFWNWVLGHVGAKLGLE